MPLIVVCDAERAQDPAILARGSAMLFLRTLNAAWRLDEAAGEPLLIPLFTAIQRLATR